jgi:tetratricopeptide (TPR) repeat protein
MRGAQRITILLAVMVFPLLCVFAEAAPPRVVVLDFSNTTKDAAVEWLGPAVAETLTTRLHGVRSLRLVERLQLYRIIQEQRLGLSDLVDPTQAAKVGKILGADQVLLGAYTTFGGTVRFTTRFVDVATAGVLATTSVNGIVDPTNPAAFWATIDSLADATVRSLSQTGSTSAEASTPPSPVVTTSAPNTPVRAVEALGNGLSFFRRHQFSDAARHLETATQLDADSAQAWLYLGETLQKLGRYPEALAASERSLRLYESRADANAQSQASTVIGLIHLHQSRYYDAQQALNRGLRLGEAVNEVARVVDALVGLGFTAVVQGQVDSALASFERSLRLSETDGYTVGTIHSLSGLAFVYARQRRFDEALKVLDRALLLSEQIDYGALVTKSLTSLGAVYSQKGDLVRALEYQERSLALIKKVGDEPALPAVYMNIGGVHKRANRFGEALRSFELGQAVAQRLGDERSLAEILVGIGHTRMEMKQYADAVGPLERALEIAQRINLAEDRIRTMRVLRDTARRCLKPRLFGC